MSTAASARVGPVPDAPVDVGVNGRREAEHTNQPELARGRCQPIECRPALIPHLAQHLREREQLDGIQQIRNGTERQRLDQRVERREVGLGAAVAGGQARDRPRAERAEAGKLVGSLGDLHRPITELDRALQSTLHRQEGRRTTEQRHRLAGKSSATRSPSSRKSSMPRAHIGVPPDRHPQREHVLRAVLRIGIGYGLPEQRRRSIGRAGIPRRATGEEESPGPVGLRSRQACRALECRNGAGGRAARNRARPAASSAAAATVSGPSAADPRCQAARSSSPAAANAFASIRCVRRRCAGSTPSSTAARNKGCANSTTRPRLMMPARSGSSSAADVEFEPVEELRERRRERRAQCDEHECGATVGGQRDDPTSYQPGEGGADRWRVVEGSAALPLRGVERAIELHQGQRISADRRHAGLRDLGLDRRTPTEQLGRRRAVESAEVEHRERRGIERARFVRTRRAIERDDWIRFDPMQREHDHIDRRGIDPLRVIDQEQERLVLRGVGEEREDAGANREPIAGTGSRAHAFEGRPL